MKSRVKWELNTEIVPLQSLRSLGVVVAPRASKSPEEPVTRWGEYWCELTVTGPDCQGTCVWADLERPRTRRCKYWPAQRAAKVI